MCCVATRISASCLGWRESERGCPLGCLPSTSVNFVVGWSGGVGGLVVVLWCTVVGDVDERWEVVVVAGGVVVCRMGGGGGMGWLRIK